jgi:tellurite resistance protein
MTTPRHRHAIHPGFSLPVVGGPLLLVFRCRPTAGIPRAGPIHGRCLLRGDVRLLIVGRLMTEQRLNDAHFPALAVLMAPPATASTAWFALNDNRITTFGIGPAAVLAMMALMQLSTSVIRRVGIA